MSGFATAGTFLGVDPGGAAVQAALTFMACRGDDPPSDGSFSGWLATLPVSPFLPLGLVWGAVGNMALACVVVAVHFAVLRVAQLCKKSDGEARLLMAARLQFPRLSIAAGEWLLTGVAVCGAAAAAGAAGDGGGAYVAGWAAVVVATAAVVVWLLAAQRVVLSAPVPLRRSTLRCPPSDPFMPPLFTLLRPRYKWTPSEEASRTGTLYEAMRGGGAYWWRWACVAVMTTVAA